MLTETRTTSQRHAPLPARNLYKKENSKLEKCRNKKKKAQWRSSLAEQFNNKSCLRKSLNNLKQKLKKVDDSNRTSVACRET